MQDAGYPDINIIAEKVAAEGQTRFEDRYRLPIGISVNMTSYSGKLLTAALYNPRLIMVYAQARPACKFLGFSRHDLRAWHHMPLASSKQSGIAQSFEGDATLPSLEQSTETLAGPSQGAWQVSLPG